MKVSKAAAYADVAREASPDFNDPLMVTFKDAHVSNQSADDVTLAFPKFRRVLDQEGRDALFKAVTLVMGGSSLTERCYDKVLDVIYKHQAIEFIADRAVVDNVE